MFQVTRKKKRRKDTLIGSIQDTRHNVGGGESETGIIGLHTYSQSPHREYDITLTGNWVERGGFRFQDFVLTRRKEVNTDGNH